jgi:hypothetical protein|tara:strand:+ start:177 stop:410 length:234 start_codon:yes stop_codon:yes gene_type:complete
MITSDANDTLESILKKIQTPQDLKGKLGVYTMFTITKALSINHINVYIQIKDPKLWEEIRKVFYPTIFEKIKKKLGF